MKLYERAQRSWLMMTRVSAFGNGQASSERAWAILCRWPWDELGVRCFGIFVDPPPIIWLLVALNIIKVVVGDEPWLRAAAAPAVGRVNEEEVDVEPA